MNKRILILALALVAFVLTIGVVVWATDPTAITPITIPTSYATSGTSLTWTAADKTNGNRFLSTGREILLIRSDSADTHTVTVTSVADQWGRTGDASKAVVAGTYAAFQMFPTHGWQSSGYIAVTTDTDLVNFAVIRVP